MSIQLGDKITIAQVKALNAANGYYFFSRDTMRFFSSRVDRVVYTGMDGWYFVASAQFTPSNGPPEARFYTVCRITLDGKVSQPQKQVGVRHSNLLAARAAAIDCAKQSGGKTK